MTSGKLKEYTLVLYLVGAIGFSFPFSRPLFILLTPFCLLLTSALLLWEFRLNKHPQFSFTLIVYLAVVYLVSLLVEMAGVHSGVIFGAYTYGRALGPQVAGTPLLIGVNWVLLVIASGALFRNVKLRRLAVLGASLAMVAYDVVMEQVCHPMELWSWEGGHIPMRNYAAWFLLALFFHALAAVLNIRFRSALAQWIFYVQLGFFLWLTLIFGYLPLMRDFLSLLILLSLAIRGGVSWINQRQRLVLPPGKTAEHPMVSVLIPARDEGKNISTLLASIAKQSYPQLEIIVCDDQSTDATVSIVRDGMASDSRLRLIQSEAPPEGWTGKNHACHLLSQTAQGSYLLFLDADVTISPDFIESAMNYSQHHRLALLSLFPEQYMKTPGEWLTVPHMHRILLSLLPLEQVLRAPYPSLAAANGQCMFFDAAIYRRYELHRQVRGKRTEDIAIARFLKGRGERVACLLGNQMVFCRMYTSYQAALNGFSRNVAQFFGGSHVLAILYALTSTTFLYPFVFSGSVLLAVTTVLAGFGIAQLNARSANQAPCRTLLFQIPQEMVFWHLLLHAILHHLGGRHTWKGRAV